jgi:pilus assembly protein Flp/PilA
MKANELWLRVTARGQGSRRLWREGRLERGASAVEYGLLIAGIAALIAIAVFAFGGGATGMFQDSCRTIMADSHVGGSCSN